MILSHPLSPVHEPRAGSIASEHLRQAGQCALTSSEHPPFVRLELGCREASPRSGCPRRGAVDVTHSGCHTYALPSPSGWGNAQHKMNATLTQSFLVGLYVPLTLPSQIRLILSVSSSSNKQNLPSICLKGERKPVSNLLPYTY